MADLLLSDYEATSWIFNGRSVRLPIVVPRANCRPAKEVYTEEVSLITSECITTDVCAPFVFAYHKFAASYSVKEIIPGIGLGCDMVSGTTSFTRRSQDSDAGFSTPFGLIRTFMDTIVLDLALAGVLTGPNFFSDGAASDKVCPAV